MKVSPCVVLALALGCSSGAKEDVPASSPSEPTTRQDPAPDTKTIEAEVEVEVEKKQAAISLFDQITSETEMNSSSLAKLYPKYKIHEDETSTPKGWSIHPDPKWDGSRIGTAFLGVDDNNKITSYTLYSKGHKIAGTEVQVGASFDQVEKELTLTECDFEFGESNWVMCTAEHQGVTIKLDWTLGQVENAEKIGEIEIKDARRMVGKLGVGQINGDVGR